MASGNVGGAPVPIIIVQISQLAHCYTDQYNII